MTVIPILLYHSVSADPPGWIAPYTVTPAVFARHVELIIDSGREAMTISRLCAALRGHTPLPERPVAITFDEEHGFADFADAAKVLAHHRLPSTLYVTTGALRGRGQPPADMAIPPAPMLDWSQLPELAELGVEIGGRHPYPSGARHHAHPSGRRRNPPLQGSARGQPSRHPYSASPTRTGSHSARTRTGRRGGKVPVGMCRDKRAQLRIRPHLRPRPADCPQRHHRRPDTRLACRLRSPRGPLRQRWRTVAWRRSRHARGPASRRGVIDVSRGGPATYDHIGDS